MDVYIVKKGDTYEMIDGENFGTEIISKKRIPLQKVVIFMITLKING